MFMKKTVRPFSGISLVFIALIAVPVYGAVKELMEIPKGEQIYLAITIAVLLFVVATILGFIFLPFILAQKAEVDKQKITLKYVTRKAGGISFPLKHAKDFLTSNIAMFGIFYADDIMHCKRAGNGFLQEQWFVAFASGVPIAIKFPDIINCKQDMFLVVEKDGTATAIELKTYSSDQVKALLRLFERATGLKSSGRVSSTGTPIKTKVANFLFGTFFVLALGTLFYLMRLDEMIVPSHTMAYQSGWKVGYVVFSMLWSFIGIAVEALRRMEKDEKYYEYKKMVIPSYFISLVAWIACFILNIFF